MYMRRAKNKTGFTLVELLLAFAIVAFVFAAIVPQFRAIINSWDSAEAAASTVQNGRVLAEHITRNLSSASQIISVSAAGNSNGYISFKDNTGVTKRYALTGGYVVFGNLGSEEQLAGPVNSFQITCYAINPYALTTDVNTVRLVQFATVFPKASALGNDKTFRSEVFIQTNNQQGLCWSNMDIGSVAAAGSATSASCGWTIKGSGVDISGNADGFHYVYQSLSGNGQIIARVYSISNTNSLAKAGVMICETLTADSKHAMMVVTPGNGTAFQRRTSTGGNSDTTAGSNVAAPYWVKLVRSGDTFSGYESSDGSAWALVGSVTISMATNVYIGMAVTSHNNGVLCTAVIDSVSSSGVMYENFSWAKAASDVASLLITTPTNVSQGDLLIASVATDDTTSLTSPAGWTPINQGSDTAGQITLGAWYKLAVVSEPASHTFTWTGGNQQAYGWIMRFTGHDSVSPINNSSPGSDSSVSPISPAVTTTAANCMILRLGAFDDNDITVGNPGLTGNAAITMDASGSAGTGPVVMLGSWLAGTTHTKETAGSNRALIFIAHAERNASTGPYLSSVTYGGRTMTRVVEVSNSSGSSITYTVAFILNDAGITAATNTTFTPVWSTAPSSVGYSSVFLKNVNQTTLTGAVAGNYTPSGATITTAALTNTSGDMVIDAATSSNTGSYTVNNGFTEALELSISSADGVGGYKPATGVSETPSVTFSKTSERQTLIGFVVKTGGNPGMVSGGAGYIKQLSIGSSGTSNFTLRSANEARTLTIAIKPADSGRCDCGDGQIQP